MSTVNPPGPSSQWEIFSLLSSCPWREVGLGFSLGPRLSRRMGPLPPPSAQDGVPVWAGSQAGSQEAHG